MITGHYRPEQGQILLNGINLCDKVAAHIARHGFDWRYAVAPAELILALKEEFGVGILNAPSAPMVLICGDQSVREMLKRGVKRPNFLHEQVAACAAPAT